MSTPQDKAKVYANMEAGIEKNGLGYYLSVSSDPAYSGVAAVDPELGDVWLHYLTVAKVIEDRVATRGQSVIPESVLPKVRRTHTDPPPHDTHVLGWIPSEGRWSVCQSSAGESGLVHWWNLSGYHTVGPIVWRELPPAPSLEGEHQPQSEETPPAEVIPDDAPAGLFLDNLFGFNRHVLLRTKLSARCWMPAGVRSAKWACGFYTPAGVYLGNSIVGLGDTVDSAWADCKLKALLSIGELARRSGFTDEQRAYVVKICAHWEMPEAEVSAP